MAFPLSVGAQALEGTEQEPPAIAPQPPHGDIWDQILGAGSLGSKLAKAGINLGFRYYGDLLGNPAGGVEQGIGYAGRLGIIVDADLEKMFGWNGASFHASVHQVQGEGLSRFNIQNLMTVSGVAAIPSTRLFNLWIEQKLGFADATVRIGQITASQEFVVSSNANLFVNATFGWPTSLSENLPSGGPNYPLATPGIRLKASPLDGVTLLAAIFNGDPAGPGFGNPEFRDLYGVNFRITDPPFLIAEADYAPKNGLDGLPTSLKFGGWLQFGELTDARYVLQALAQGDVLNSGFPGRNGDYGLYGVLDQMLWKVPGTSDQGLNMFARLSVSPSDRNLVDFYGDGGFTYKGLLPDRSHDIAGIALAYAHISTQVNAAPNISPGATAGPWRDYEMTVELTYQAEIDSHWHIQPDVQYIIHPGGHAPNPLVPSGTSAIPNAFVIGSRLIAKF